MNKPFKIRVKLPEPLTLEQIAAKYALKDSDLAKIRTFVRKKWAPKRTRPARHGSLHPKKAAR